MKKIFLGIALLGMMVSANAMITASVSKTAVVNLKGDKDKKKKKKKKESCSSDSTKSGCCKEGEKKKCCSGGK